MRSVRRDIYCRMLEWYCQVLLPQSTARSCSAMPPGKSPNIENRSRVCLPLVPDLIWFIETSMLAFNGFSFSSQSKLLIDREFIIERSISYSSTKLFFYRNGANYVIARGSPPKSVQIWWFLRSLIELYCFGIFYIFVSCYIVSGFLSKSFSISGCKFFPAFFSSNSSANAFVRLSSTKTFSANPSKLFIL